MVLIVYCKRKIYFIIIKRYKFRSLLIWQNFSFIFISLEEKVVASLDWGDGELEDIRLPYSVFNLPTKIEDLRTLIIEYADTMDTKNGSIQLFKYKTFLQLIWRSG